MTQTYPSDGSKACFRCNERKSRSEFYAHPQMADGLLGKCKACARADMKKTRAENLEEYRDRDRKRWPRRKASKRVPNDTNPAARASSLAAWKERNQDKVRAHMALGNAVRDGRVIKEPCLVCGSAESHGHHEDYSKPLAVVWLCAEHHGMWHRIQREVIRVIGRADAGEGAP